MDICGLVRPERVMEWTNSSPWGIFLSLHSGEVFRSLREPNIEFVREGGWGASGMSADGEAISLDVSLSCLGGDVEVSCYAFPAGEPPSDLSDHVISSFISFFPKPD